MAIFERAWTADVLRGGMGWEAIDSFLTDWLDVRKAVNNDFIDDFWLKEQDGWCVICWDEDGQWKKGFGQKPSFEHHP